jgi:hypothetical protein
MKKRGKAMNKNTNTEKTAEGREGEERDRRKI